MADEKPLATYTERLLEVRRVFDLYRDRVVVRAHWLLKNKRIEHTVRLDSLKAAPREVKVRYRMHRYAGWVLAIGALIFAAAYYKAQGGPLGIVGYIGAAVTAVGVMLMAMTYNKRHVTFLRFDPITPPGGLDIARAGPDVERFDEFIKLLKKQIKKSG